VTLRAAVMDANAGVGSTIYVPRGKYKFGIAGSGGDNQGDLEILRSINIIGTGAGETIIDADRLDRVFEVTEPLGQQVTLALDSLTVTGGRAPADPYYQGHGGGILVGDGATLVLRKCAIVDNETVNVLSFGGAIFFNATAGGEITDTVITGNRSNYYTGGVFLVGTVSQPPVTVTRSIIANNMAAQNDGKNTGTQSGRNFVSGGNNRLGNDGGGFVVGQNNDYFGTPNYIVTGVADTFNSSDNARVASLRDAINLANTTVGAEEIWVPAWKFLLSIERPADRVAFPTDVTAAYGDLDVGDSLTIRGISSVGGSTSVAWRVGAVSDAVFDLLGDYNGDGINSPDDGNVTTNDRVVWQSTLGSTMDLRADGDDDGTVDQDDYGIWFSHYGNTLTLISV
jgi:hypothetical protein